MRGAIIMNASKNTYQAIGAIGLVFLLLRLFFALEWAPYVGLGVITLALLIPFVARFLAKGWYFVADEVAQINSFIIMSIIFCVIVMPIGYIRRIFSTKKEGTTGNFKYVNETYNAEYFKNPW